MTSMEGVTQESAADSSRGPAMPSRTQAFVPVGSWDRAQNDLKFRTAVQHMAARNLHLGSLPFKISDSLPISPPERAFERRSLFPTTCQDMHEQLSSSQGNASGQPSLGASQDGQTGSCDCCGLAIAMADTICAGCLAIPGKYRREIIDRYTLSEEQVEVLDQILEGDNVFITGAAGTGKTRLAQAVAHYFKGLGLVVAAIAPEGIPATSIGGTTLTSIMHAYIGWGGEHAGCAMDELLSRVSHNTSHTAKSLVDAVVIDEASMVDSNSLTRLAVAMSAAAARTSRERAKLPFGGAQVIMVGDPHQLSPLLPLIKCVWCGTTTAFDVAEGARKCPYHGTFFLKDRFAWCSPVWEKCNFRTPELTGYHRQRRESFIMNLDNLRSDGGSKTSIPVENLLLNQMRQDSGVPAITVYSKLSDADALNNAQFNSIDARTVQYRAFDNFLWHETLHPGLDGYAKRNSAKNPLSQLKALQYHEFRYRLDLKIGAMVMLVSDVDVANGLACGRVGEVVAWRDFDDVDHAPAVQGSTGMLRGEHQSYREEQIDQFAQSQYQENRLWPVVRFFNGVTRTITASCAVQELGVDKPRSLLSRTQIPLVPGWATSIRKIQGLTLDRAVLALDGCDQEGEAYTAISRTRDVTHLRLASLPERFKSSPQAREFLEMSRREERRKQREEESSDYSFGDEDKMSDRGFDDMDIDEVDAQPPDEAFAIDDGDDAGQCDRHGGVGGTIPQREGVEAAEGEDDSDGNAEGHPVMLPLRLAP